MSKTVRTSSGGGGLGAGAAMMGASALLGPEATAGVEAAQAALKTFGQAIKITGVAVTALGAGVVTAMLGAAQSFAKTGEELARMSQRTGIAAEQLSLLQQVGEKTGVSLEQVENSIRHLQKTLVTATDSGGEAAMTIASLGLNLAQLRSMSPDQQFQSIAEKLSTIKDGTLRAADAMKIFGKTGTEVLPLIDGFAAAAARAKQLGAVMSKEDIEAATALSAAMKDVKLALTGIVNAIGSAVSPILTEIATDFANVTGKVTEYLRANKQVIITALEVAAGIMAVTAALTAAAVAAPVLILGFLAIANPAGQIIAVFAGITGATLYFTGALGKMWSVAKSAFTYVADAAAKAFGGIRNALKGGDLGLAFSIGFSAMKLEVFKGIDSLWKLVSDALGHMTEAILAALGVDYVANGVAFRPSKRTQGAQDEYDDLLAQAKKYDIPDAEKPKTPSMEGIGEAIKAHSAGLFNVGNAATAFELGAGSGNWQKDITRTADGVAALLAFQKKQSNGSGVTLV